jgi:calcineurin-like phosphoesterase family protein
MKIQINNKQNLFFSSDFHYGHAGIVKGTSNWTDTSRCRPFETVEEHDKVLVDNINKTVGKDDVLVFLGDWSFGAYATREHITNIRKLREQLHCQTIHFYEGNHDDEIRKNKDNAQELFTSFNQAGMIYVVEQPTEQGVKPIKQPIFLSHYAHRVWDKSHNGAWHLYGHSHGSLDEMTPLIANPTWIGDKYFVKNYRTMDVGVDTHPEFRPYSYQEIKAIMEKRAVELEVDHHGEIN